MTVLLSLILSTLTFAGPASAGCNEPGERNNVQCSINHKKEKGGKGNDIHTGSLRTRLTVTDQGGVDQLNLADVSMTRARFSTKGNDLYINFGNNKGSVVIKNHSGSGRIEAIKFRDGNRVRFNDKGAVFDGPLVAKATAANDGKDVEIEFDPRFSGSGNIDLKEGTIEFKVESGLGLGGKFDIGGILSDIIDAVARALGGDGAKDKGGDSGDNGFTGDKDSDKDGIPDVRDKQLGDPKDRGGDCRNC